MSHEIFNLICKKTERKIENECQRGKKGKMNWIKLHNFSPFRVSFVKCSLFRLCKTSAEIICHCFWLIKLSEARVLQQSLSFLLTNYKIESFQSFHFVDKVYDSCFKCQYTNFCIFYNNFNEAALLLSFIRFFYWPQIQQSKNVFSLLLKKEQGETNQ